MKLFIIRPHDPKTAKPVDGPSWIVQTYDEALERAYKLNTDTETREFGHYAVIDVEWDGGYLSY